MSTPVASYTEFAVSSNFSFLRGASHPEELAATAAQLGMAGFGLADRNSVAGVVRAHAALRDIKEADVRAPRYHPGARLIFAGGADRDLPDVLAYPANRRGWGRLCRLLTLGNRRAKKGECHIGLSDLLDWSGDLELIVMPNASLQPPELAATLPPLLQRLCEARPGAVHLAGSLSYDGEDRLRLACLDTLARESATPLIAVNEVLYHVSARRLLQDVLTCIRTHTTLETAGRRLGAHAEHHLKSPAEMQRLFHRYPDAVRCTQRLSAKLTFSLDELRYEYPEETITGFDGPQEALVHFAYQGARDRYPDGVPEKIRLSLAHEIALIGVNHLEAHLYANWLEVAGRPYEVPELPALGLIVSGGHTDIVLMSDHGVYRRLGRTRDDAAGEAFDKVGRLLGLGFPGGPAIERTARGAEPPRLRLPRHCRNR